VTAALPVFPALPYGFPIKWTPTLKTTIGTASSGREARLNNQPSALHQFELVFEELRDQTQNAIPFAELAGFTQYMQLCQLWLGMYGRFGLFYFDAPWDDSRTDQLIGTGDGTTTGFVVSRTVGIGAVTITEFVGGLNTVINVKIAGVPTSAYTVSGNAIILNTAPSLGAAITATFSFYYVCRFMEDNQDFEEFYKDRWTVNSLKFRSITLGGNGYISGGGVGAAALPFPPGPPITVAGSTYGMIVVEKNLPIPPDGEPQTIATSLSNAPLAPPAVGQYKPTVSGLLLTTTTTNTFIVLFISAEKGTGPPWPAVSSITTTSGLVFTKHYQDQDLYNSSAFSGLFYADVEIWAAPAAAALTNELITVNFNVAVRSAVMYGMAFNLINAASPWDPNPGLPAVLKNTSTTSLVPRLSDIATSNPRGVLLAFCVNYNNPVVTQAVSPSPGFTYGNGDCAGAFILRVGSNTIGSWNTANGQYMITTVPQSGLFVTTSIGVPSSFFIILALTAN
jgi:hypothetical protein